MASFLSLHVKDRLVRGLERRAVQVPSRWATTYRMLSEPFPGPWSFKFHPWLREMHDATEPRIVGNSCLSVW